MPHAQSTHERAKDLHAEAEGLLEEVLNSAEGRVGYPPPKPSAKRNRSKVASEDDKVTTELFPLRTLSCMEFQASKCTSAHLSIPIPQQ